MIVLIDNGHGSNTPGKRSPDAVKGLTGSPHYLRECEWTRGAARDLGIALRSRGIEAGILVTEETDVPLATRAQRVNNVCRQRGKDNVLLVSIHINAAGNGDKWLNARGWSIYTSKGVTKSDQLADCIFQEAVKQFRAPLSVRRSMDKYLERDFEENFTILAKTQCPAVLVENFFQDNRDDVAYLKSAAGRVACVDVMARGIEAYLRK